MTIQSQIFIKISCMQTFFYQILSVLVCGLGLSYTAVAHSRPIQLQPTSVSQTVTVSQYELALAQVLFEMCPTMLTKEQQLRFYEAYQHQLRAFIPTSGDPNETMRQLGNQKNYQNVLQNVRTWTASFPPQENQKLCQEFARKTGTF